MCVAVLVQLARTPRTRLHDATDVFTPVGDIETDETQCGDRACITPAQQTREEERVQGHGAGDVRHLHVIARKEAIVFERERVEMMRWEGERWRQYRDAAAIPLDREREMP